MAWLERLKDLALRRLRAAIDGEYSLTGYVPVPEKDDLEFTDSERAGRGIGEAWRRMGPSEDYIKTAEQTFWNEGGANGTGEID